LVLIAGIGIPSLLHLGLLAQASQGDCTDEDQGRCRIGGPVRRSYAQGRGTAAWSTSTPWTAMRSRRWEAWYSASAVTLGLNSDLPSLTRGRGRMRESRTSGSVRGGAISVPTATVTSIRRARKLSGISSRQWGRRTTVEDDP